MLNELSSQNVSKEIFVTVDQPTDDFQKEIEQFENENVQFIINKERTGKANALNNAVQLSSGNVLLFLDSDIGLPNDPDYLRKIIMEMQQTDILGHKKESHQKQIFPIKNGILRILNFQY